MLKHRKKLCINVAIAAGLGANIIERKTLYKTFRLLADENKKLSKRIDELEKKINSMDQPGK